MRIAKALIVVACCAALSWSVSAAFTVPNTSVYDRLTVPMASDWAAIVQAIGGQGVTDGCLVSPRSPATSTLDVADCDVRINGVDVNINAGTVTIGAPHVTFGRLDMVIARSSGIFDVVAGTPAATPYTGTLPTTAVLLATVYIPSTSNTISASNLVDKRVTPTESSGGSSFPFEIDVTAYGAVCDGSTDDSDAIQDAFDAALAVSGRAAEVVFPSTRCSVDTALVLGSATAGVDSYLSIRGVSSASSGLIWNGSTSATVLKLSRIKYFSITHFGIVNNVAVGTTTGILEGGNSAGYGGTQTLAGVFTDVSVTGFATGIMAGNAAGVQAAASEILYQDVGFYSNTTGFSAQDANSLLHLFVNPSCDANGTCLDFASSTGEVLSGSFSNSTVTDIDINANGAFNITGIRSEGANRFVTCNTGCTVTLESNEVVSPSNADQIVVAGSYASLSVLGCVLNGKVSVTAFVVTMTNSRVIGDTDLPFFAAGQNTRYTQSGNSYIGSGNISTDRFYGASSGFVGAITILGLDTTTDYPIYSQSLPPNNPAENTSSLTAWLLKRVRMLSEGTRVDGQNLRVQTTLGAGTTTAFTFQRNVTVNINYEQLLITSPSASNRFYLSDVGKPVTLVGISLNPVGANVTRVIDQYVNSGSVTVAPVSAYMFGAPAQTGITATIGANEPDANYMVQGSCQIPVAIGFDTLSTSGFVFAANSPGNVCTALVLR